RQPESPRPGRLSLGVARNNLGAGAPPGSSPVAPDARTADQNPSIAGRARAVLPPRRRVGEHRIAFRQGSRPSRYSSISTRPRAPLPYLPRPQFIRPVPSVAAVKGEIRQRALDLGFDSCSFTTASPPFSAARFQ